MKDQTVNRMFLDRIREGGDSVRYLVPEAGSWRRVTYSEVGRAAREVACGLMSLGLSRGDRVAILCGTRYEWALADIGAVLGGFLTVPIYPSSLPEQAEYILAHCGARLLFAEDEEQRNKVAGAAHRLPALAHVVLLTGEPPAGAPGTTGLDSLREAGRAWDAAHPGAFEARNAEIGPDDDLTVTYTSGTTGPPKGVVSRHRNYLFLSASCREAVPVLRKGQTMLHFLPTAHTLGRMEHILSFDVMIVSAFARSVQTVAEDLAAVRPDIMVSVPRLYEKFHAKVLSTVSSSGFLKRALFGWALSVGREVSRIRQGGGEPRGATALRFLVADRLVFRKLRARLGGRLAFFVSGGAPLSPEIAEFFHAMGVLILEGYGMTENCSVASVNRVERYKFGTVGLAMPGTEIRLAPDGEILIRGPHVFKEYLDDPAATREAIDADGWLHSGDIGTMDAEGFLRVTDRKKDLIVTSGGKNIAPQNIENLLRNDPYVSQAFVYGDRRKYLTAILTLSPDETLAWAADNGIGERDLERLAGMPEVRAFFRERVELANRHLASFEQVKRFILLGRDFTQEAGELTPTLKLKRKVVIEKFGARLDALYEKD
jgi:long-chain acyl-CoA synthetase